MDSSDKEDIIKNKLPTEKPKRHEKYPEVVETAKTYQEKEFIQDTLVSLSVKRKSEPYFENQRKRSADNVRKESDENVTDCTNIQHTVLAKDHSKKNEKRLIPVTLPCIRIASLKEDSKQADQAINEEENFEKSDETDSAIHAIKASVSKYFTSATDQCGSDGSKPLLSTNIDCTNSNRIINISENLKEEIIVKQQIVTKVKPMSVNEIQSENSQICVSSKVRTKVIDENLLVKEQVADEIKTSKFEESEETCTNCKQRFYIPVISLGKRKFDETVEDDKKRKRSAGNDENVTDSLNVQDTTLYPDLLKKQEKHLVNTVVSFDGTTKGCVKEQDIAINKTHQSPIKYKITETTSETDFQTHETKTSKYASTPDQTQHSDNVLLIEDADVSSTENRSISFVERSSLSSVLDNVKEGGIINLPNKCMDESTPEDRLKYSKTEDMPTEYLSNIWDFHENPKSELPKEEDKLVKFPSKIRNIKLLCDIPLQMSHISAGTSKSEVLNSRKSHENAPLEESMQRQGIIGGHLHRSSSRLSPVKLFSDSECDLNSIYIELESNIINFEHMENTEFIESQRQILESISQQQRLSTMPEFHDDKGKLPAPFENKGPEEVGPEVSVKEALKVYALYKLLGYDFESHGLNPEDLSKEELISLLMTLAQLFDPGSISNIPHIVINYRECLRQSPAAVKIAYERSMKERLKKKDNTLNPVTLAEGFPGTIPLYPLVNPISPDSSTPENEPDISSETDSPKFREYPGLAKDPTNVKKDARFQKKFYKQKKPVILPINQSGGAASVSEIEPNIDSEENRMQVNDDDPRIETQNSEFSILEEKYQEYLSILLTNKELLKEKSEDKLSAEGPTKVKKDSRYQKRIYTLTPGILPIFESKDGGSSEIKPNVDFDKNQIQRVGVCLQRMSRKNEDSVHQEPEEASNSTSEYKISSFMEESPNSSQSISPNINKESWHSSMVEIIPQIKGLAERSMSIASKIPSSQAGPSQSPQSLGSQARPSQSPGSQALPSQSHIG